MAPFGNASGPVYPLGKFSPTAGTVLPLSTNVKLTDGFGTSANPSPLKATQVKVMTPKANTGNMFLVFKAQAAATSPGTSVILVVPPGSERVVESKQISAAFTLDQWGIDTDNTGDSCWVTAVIA